MLKMARTLNKFVEVQAVLKHPEFVQALYDAGAVIMADALITLHGTAHSQRRVMEMGVFQRGFFRQYEQEVFPAVLMPRLDAAIAQGEVDLVDFGYRVTMHLTAHFAGIDGLQAGSGRTEALLTLVKKFSEGATLAHSTRTRSAVEEEVRAALETFRSEFFEPSRARRSELVRQFEAGEIELDALPQDVMTTLLKGRNACPLKDEVFLREMAFYLQAGAHSTANAVTRVLHELLVWREQHPRAWQQHAADPTFLQRCVHESLRLYPASPVAKRRALQSIQLDELALAPFVQGEEVTLDLAAANRDVALFGDDANVFNPLRPLPSNVWPWGLSFGYGAHACLGRVLDGGAYPQAGEQQLGIVTLMLRALVDAGVSIHPAQKPAADTNTTRPNWRAYPVAFAR